MSAHAAARHEQEHYQSYQERDLDVEWEASSRYGRVLAFVLTSVLSVRVGALEDALGVVKVKGGSDLRNGLVAGEAVIGEDARALRADRVARDTPYIREVRSCITELRARSI